MMPGRERAGLSLYTRNLTRRLRAAGVEVDLVGYATGREDRAALEAECGGPVDLLETPRRVAVDLTDQARAVLSERVAAADLVHLHGMRTRLNVFAAAAARRARTPLLVSPHGQVHPWQMAQHRWRKRVLDLFADRRIYRRAAGVVAVSEEEAGHVRAFAPRTPVTVIPPGVEPVQARDAAAPPDLGGGGGRTLLYLADLSRRKGVDLLADAWLRAAPAGCRLVLAGRATEFGEEDVRGWVDAAPAASPIVRAGPVSDAEKAALFSEADGFVMPSRAEAFGIVVAEALSAGVPCIATRATPWSCLADSGAGWHVDTSAAGLAAGIAAWAAADDLPARGAAAEGLYRGRFSPEAETSAYLRVYGNLLDAPLLPHVAARAGR